MIRTLLYTVCTLYAWGGWSGLCCIHYAHYMHEVDDQDSTVYSLHIICMRQIHILLSDLTPSRKAQVSFHD